MSGQIFTINFRGTGLDVEVDLDATDASVNYRSIEWHFLGMSPEEHEQLKITDDEEDSISEVLAERLDERYAGCG